MKEAWLIYDGKCPMCSNFASMYRVRQNIKLQLIDAREQSEIMERITSRKLNLDEGMVLIMDDIYYHGVEASIMLALIGSKSGAFNKLNCYIFSSPTAAKVLYPLLRCVRNMLLYIKGIPKINNVQN